MHVICSFHEKTYTGLHYISRVAVDHTALEEHEKPSCTWTIVWSLVVLLFQSEVNLLSLQIFADGSLTFMFTFKCNNIFSEAYQVCVFGLMLDIFTKKSWIIEKMYVY